MPGRIRGRYRALFRLEPGKRLRLDQGVDLLTQSHVLEQPVRARAAEGSQALEQDGQREVQGLHGRRC